MVRRCGEAGGVLRAAGEYMNDEGKLVGNKIGEIY